MRRIATGAQAARIGVRPRARDPSTTSAARGASTVVGMASCCHRRTTAIVPSSAASAVSAASAAKFFCARGAARSASLELNSPWRPLLHATAPKRSSYLRKHAALLLRLRGRRRRRLPADARRDAVDDALRRVELGLNSTTASWVHAPGRPRDGGGAAARPEHDARRRRTAARDRRGPATCTTRRTRSRRCLKTLPAELAPAAQGRARDAPRQSGMEARRRGPPPPRRRGRGLPLPDRQRADERPQQIRLSALRPRHLPSALAQLGGKTCSVTEQPLDDVAARTDEQRAELAEKLEAKKAAQKEEVAQRSKAAAAAAGGAAAAASSAVGAGDGRRRATARRPRAASQRPGVRGGARGRRRRRRAAGKAPPRRSRRRRRNRRWAARRRRRRRRRWLRSRRRLRCTSRCS